MGDEEIAESEIQKMTKGYNYLLSMALWSLTLEKVEKLKKEKEEKHQELDTLCNTSPQQLWEYDLDNLLVALDQFDRVRLDEIEQENKLRKKHKKKVKRKKQDDDDEYIPGGKKKKSKARSKPRGGRGKKKSVKTETQVKKDVNEA